MFNVFHYHCGIVGGVVCYDISFGLCCQDSVWKPHHYWHCNKRDCWVGNLIIDYYRKNRRRYLNSPFFWFFYLPPAQLATLTLLRPASKRFWEILTLSQEVVHL